MTNLEIAQTFGREAAERISRESAEPAWARTRRLQAWEVFESTPMPARTDEEWRRTDLGALKLEEYRPAGGSSRRVGFETDLSGLVSAGGATVCAEAAEQGVIFTSLEHALQEHPDLVQAHVEGMVPPTYNKFAALNGAFWQGGTFLYVPRGVSLALPFVSMRSMDDEGALLPRSLLILEAGSSVTYVEVLGDGSLQGQGEAPEGSARRCLHSGVTDIVLKEESRFHYVTVQDWPENVWDFSVTRASVGANARLGSMSVGLGARSSRSHLEAVLEGKGAEAQLRGIYCGGARQHFEYRTLQDHAAPHSRSDLLYKGALKDRSNAAYTGTVRVRPEGVHTTSSQVNHNLLLNSGAKADSVPILEILAKDIDKCSHGATAGQVNESQLFYLMSRGLSRAEAYELIVVGFFEPVIRQIPVPQVQERVWAALSRKLALRYVEHD